MSETESRHIVCGPGKQPNRCGRGHFLVSGNPGGMARETADLKRLAQLYTEDAWEIVIEIMNDEAQPGSVRLAAAELALSRGHGKPKESVEVTTPEITNRIRDAAAQAKLEVGH